MTMSEGDGTNGAQRLTSQAPQPRKKFAIPPVKNACLSWYVATPQDCAIRFPNFYLVFIAYLNSTMILENLI